MCAGINNVALLEKLKTKKKNTLNFGIFITRPSISQVLFIKYWMTCIIHYVDRFNIKKKNWFQLQQ